MNITIEKIVYPGKSLGRINGKVVFTDQGLPGEVVEIEVVKDTKQCFYAKTLNIVEPSSHRIKPLCSHYQVCAPYQTIQYDYQLELKKEQVQDMARHLLGMELENLTVTPSSEQWGYRNKGKYHVVWENGRAYYSYFKVDSNQEYEILSKCELFSEPMHVLFEALLEVINAKGLKRIQDVEIRESYTTKEMSVLLYLKKAKSLQKIRTALMVLSRKYLIKSITGFVPTTNEGMLFFGEPELSETIDEKTLIYGPLSFFQINIPLLTTLKNDLEKKLAFTGDETIADLYCGVGTFGILFADKVKHVVGLEDSSDNTVYVHKNTLTNRLSNYSLITMSAEEGIVGVFKQPIDIVLVDPPRKGLDERVITSFLEHLPQKIVYVSCNPATLMRDLKKLQPSYDITDMTCYDFFPHTPHIEICVILEKK